jgi:cell division protein FtsA
MLDKFKDLSRTAVTKASAAVGKAGDAASKIKSDEDQHIVALDIGTEFVKALVAKVSTNGEIEIIGVGRAHQKLSDMQAGAISDIASVVQNCDKALSDAEEQAGVSARSAIIGIAGELVKGTTTTVRVSRKNRRDGTYRKVGAITR